MWRVSPALLVYSADMVPLEDQKARENGLSSEHCGAMWRYVGDCGKFVSEKSELWVSLFCPH
jgi:hypothetical protein